MSNRLPIYHVSRFPINIFERDRCRTFSRVFSPFSLLTNRRCRGFCRFWRVHASPYPSCGHKKSGSENEKRIPLVFVTISFGDVVRSFSVFRFRRPRVGTGLTWHTTRRVARRRLTNEWWRLAKTFCTPTFAIGFQTNAAITLFVYCLRRTFANPR